MSAQHSSDFEDGRCFEAKLKAGEIQALRARLAEAEAKAERERARADDHDSARQSEKERADYAETRLAEAEERGRYLLDLLSRYRCFLTDAPKGLKAEIAAALGRPSGDAHKDAQEPEPQLPCPHSRPSWRICPHCMGLNEQR